MLLKSLQIFDRLRKTDFTPAAALVFTFTCAHLPAARNRARVQFAKENGRRRESCSRSVDLLGRIVLMLLLLI